MLCYVMLKRPMQAAQNAVVRAVQNNFKLELELSTKSHAALASRDVRTAALPSRSSVLLCKPQVVDNKLTPVRRSISRFEISCAQAHWVESNQSLDLCH